MDKTRRYLKTYFFQFEHLFTRRPADSGFSCDLQRIDCQTERRVKHHSKNCTFLTTRATLSSFPLIGPFCSSSSAAASTPTARSGSRSTRIVALCRAESSARRVLTKSRTTAGRLVCPLEKAALRFARLGTAVKLPSLVWSFFLHGEQLCRLTASARHSSFVIILSPDVWLHSARPIVRSTALGLRGRIGSIGPKEEIATSRSLRFGALVKLAARVRTFFSYCEQYCTLVATAHYHRVSRAERKQRSTFCDRNDNSFNYPSGGGLRLELGLAMERWFEPDAKLFALWLISLKGGLGTANWSFAREPWLPCAAGRLDLEDPRAESSADLELDRL